MYAGMRISKIHIVKADITLQGLAVTVPASSLIAGDVCRNSFMRFCEAAARCVMLAVQPMALTGNVSIWIYITNSAILPTARAGHVIGHIQPADHNRDQCTQADQQCHAGKIDGFCFCQAQGIRFICFTVGLKNRSMAFSCTKDLITLMPEYDSCALVVRSAEQRLYTFTFSIDDGIYKINSDSQNGQGTSATKVSLTSDRSMKKILKPNHCSKVDKIHDGRPGIHSHPAYIFGNPVHQVAGAVCFIKLRVQLLVMAKYLVLLVIFNMPAHHNDRLPHQEHKKPADNSQDQ